MENNWKAWKPSADICRRYSTRKVIFDEHGLKLYLFNAVEDSRITIQFLGKVYAYRCTEELAALNILNSIASDQTLHIVEDSTYARKIEADSYGAYSFSQLIHVGIIDADFLQEIITDALPEIMNGWD